MTEIVIKLSCQRAAEGVEMETKVLSVRRYKVGYEVRRELCEVGDGGDTVILKSAYTIPEGYYIGDSVWAHRLIVQRGIKPEPMEPGDPEANGGRGRTCTIGFCKQHQMWAGWSHRAIALFEIGDEVKEGDCCASSGWTNEWLQGHPEDDLSLPIGFVAKSLNDCKRMAIAFAESVS